MASLYPERDSQDLSSLADRTSLSTTPIPASAQGSLSTSAVVPGSLADRNHSTDYVKGPQNAQPRPSNPTPGPSEQRPLISPNRQESVQPVNETTHLLSAQGQMVSGSINGPVGNIDIPVNERETKCSKPCVILASLSIVCTAAILLLFTLFGAVAHSSSSSTLTYPNDVVYVERVPGFWYNQLTLSYKQQTLSREGIDEAQVAVYYVGNPAVLETSFTATSPPKNFSNPQVLMVNGSHQNYLLEGSYIEFNFSIKNPSDYSATAKICQFSTLADYSYIVDKTITNKSIIEAEKRGECQPLQQPPNKFDIHKSGYYWYVVSTLLSNDDCVQTSFEYGLTKLYYDTPLLGTSHDCSLTNSRSECVFANSLFVQTSTKQVLVSLTNTDSPYEVTIKRKYAVGIALVPFLILELLAVLILMLSIKYACKYRK